MPTINLNKQKPTNPRNPYFTPEKQHYDSKWHKLRNAYLMQHPLCEMCLKKGIITPAKEIHHIKPISTGKDELEQQYLTYDWNNLMSLCIKCHHRIHQKMKH